MVNKPKILGTSFEVDVCAFLREHGFPLAERRAQEGKNDRGDVAGTPHVFECKNLKSIDLAGGMDELKGELSNAGTEFGFLIVKRRRKSTGEAYACMTLEQLTRLLERLPDGQ